MKNTSPDSEDTQLFTVFSAHFKGELNLARIRIVCLFITALCRVKSVNYSRLSIGFGSPPLASSCFRSLQRFMAVVDLPMRVVAKLIFGLLPITGPLILVMDRTNWRFGERDINILMLGVSYRNVAFPLMFRMLDKRGNSNIQERIVLVRDFIDCLLADREFVGKQWLGSLNGNNIRYHIGIRNNFKVFTTGRQKPLTAWHLFNKLGVNELGHYEKIVRMHGEYCYLSGT